MTYFKDKTIWITGGGSGIGRSLAREFALQGGNVVVSGRSEKTLKESANGVENILPVVLDVTKSENWESATKKVISEFGKIDMVIFSAGCCEYIDLPEFDAEKFFKVMETNFLGIINGIEATLPHLLETHRSRLVAVTSSVAALPLPRAEAYGASKAAATYLMDSLRLDLKQFGVETSVVMPGFVETPMTDKNDFPMPCMISADDAAKIIVKALKKGKRHVYFPARFTWPLRFLGMLPIAIQQFFTRRFVR